MGRHSKIQTKDGMLKIKCSTKPRKERRHKGEDFDNNLCNDICDMGLEDNVNNLINGDNVQTGQTRNLDLMYNPLTNQCFKCNGGAIATVAR